MDFTLTYRDKKRAVLSFLILYACAGFLANLAPRGEVYPFFSWSLFSAIPNQIKMYTIEISRIGNTYYDPPLLFSETKFLFDRIGQSPTQYLGPIQGLGYAIDERGDIEAKQNVVAKMFSSDTYTYTVYYVVYDPLELYTTGDYTRKEKKAEINATPDL